MKNDIITKNQQFIGRSDEWLRLTEISDDKQANILIMYGRRRVGKTELLEQAYRKRNLIKIEGIANQPEALQRQHALKQLSKYFNDPLLDHVQIDGWTDLFEIIHKLTKTGLWSIYFEEVQWLANYKDNFISELKYVWDNNFRHNNKLLLILCGSSPSFMINQVLHSKALYNRSQYEFALYEFTLQEAKLMLNNRSNQEVMDAYLTVGGVPDYLKRIQKQSSVLLGICENAFVSGGYFAHEKSRIFTSSMANNHHYEKIIALLSKQKFSTRQEIASHLKVQPGGVLSDVLKDLEICGFIEKYSPYNLGENSKIARYCIADPYLQFYFKFIQNKLDRIKQGQFNQNPLTAINQTTYRKWLGFSFERFCRRHHYQIAKLLGFGGVSYQSGTFYNRAVNIDTPGYQIDLVFDRDDRVYTICEIKYTQAPVGIKVIAEMEQKLELFPNKKNKTIQKVLISAEGAQESLVNKGYFDRILTLEDFF